MNNAATATVQASERAVTKPARASDSDSPLRQVRIDKITLNFGAGKEQARLEKGVALIKTLTGIEPVRTVAKRRIPSWGLRPGLPIGCKLTLRKAAARAILKRLLSAKENRLLPKQFDNSGNLSFGIAEYIDIPDIEYDPKIGIMGLEISVTLSRPGYRIKCRHMRSKKIPPSHRITKEDAMAFIQKEFGVRIGKEEE